jgi:fructosamine-3-kinase
MQHPLLGEEVKRAIEDAASGHLGRRWVSDGFTDLKDRASHPCGLLHGESLTVFAKLSLDANAGEQVGAELCGLAFLQQWAGVTTPTPIGSGVVAVGCGTVLLLEGLPERAPENRTPEDWRSIGRTLARLHRVHDDRFGLAQFDGFFGPLPQDNRPVSSNRWADFYAERRLIPCLRSAVDSGHLPVDLAGGIERLLSRLPGLCGPEPRPSLLHGDAQRNNFVSTDGGAVVVDAAPYFGHPEIDLALIDYLQPASDEVLAGYGDVTPIDPGFPRRRDLWRMFAYLAVVSVDGDPPFGRRMLARLASAVRSYQ